MAKVAQVVRVAAAVYSILQECLLCWRKETEKKSTFFLRKVRYGFRSFSNGVLAQLVERLNGIEEVRGSNPLGSRLRPVARSSGRLRLAGRTPPRRAGSRRRPIGRDSGGFVGQAGTLRFSSQIPIW